jgi:hypothetical protein
MRHSTWVRMRSSELIIDIINNIAEDERDPADQHEPEASNLVEEEKINQRLVKRKMKKSY